MLTKSISLEVWKKNDVLLTMNKGEVNSRFIKVTFKDSGETFSLADRQVTFYAKKPDKTTIFNSCEVDAEQNIATVVVTSQVVSTAGIVDFEFEIFDSENSLLKVSGFKIVVLSKSNFSEEIESTSEYNALVQALNKAENAAYELEKCLETSGTISSSIGELSDLSTEEKSSIVGAINELDKKVIPISQGGTGQTTLESAKSSLGILSETVLYNNESGTQGTITLSDSAENYSCMEIYYRNDSSSFKSVRVDNPNGKSIVLENVGHYDNQSYLRAAAVLLSGTSVSWQDHLTGYQIVQPDSSIIASENNLIFINKIVGYSY